MKPVIAFCLLCVASAWAQNPPANMVMESSAPSIQINFVGQEGGFYKFNVKNASEHGVTAFNVRLLTAESKNVAGKPECDNRCGETGELGTKSRPVIAPGGVFPLSYPTNTVPGGVVIEAALLDDNTFQGDEHAAARLLAQKIGFQSEHDRILPVVSRVMSDSRLDDLGKIVQLRQELQWLSVDPDPATIQNFQQKFSNSADCGDTCTQLMQSTATSEKQLILSKLEQFSSEEGAKGASLAKWWENTKQNVISFSCDDCSPTTPNPVTEPPVLRQPPDGNDNQRTMGRPPVTN